MINAFFFLMIFGQFLAATSQVLLKVSAGRKYDSFIKEYLNVWVFGGYGLLLATMIITIFCYSGLDYMAVVVIEPISYIMVMIYSRLIFKEKITAGKMTGMALIIAGIAVFYIFG